MKNGDVAIVGMSCYFPGANNIEEFWNNLVNGVDSITDAPEERIDPRYFSKNGTVAADRFYFKKGGFVTPLKIDPLRYGILPIAAEGIDSDQLIALRLVEEALIDAGVYEKKIPLKNCSFVLGKGNYTGIAGLRVGEIVHVSTLFENIVKYLFPDLPEDEINKIKTEYQIKQGRFQADTASGAMPNLVVSLAANKFDMRGPAYTVDAACASSLIAIEHSINFLLSGQCDIALAGGMHLGQGATFWSIFNVINAASLKQQIAPFSESADGVLIGEGAGIVVLKRLEKAIADKDRIYAVIKGSGVASDGSDVSVLAPSSKGQMLSLQLAWERAGMNPERIGYVETHGTATQIGDKTEMTTLIDFFGNQSAPPALLGSVKSNIGHAMPAAGMAGLIKTALALYYKKIPPTLHCEKPMKEMFKSRFQPVQKLIDWDEKKYPLIAAVNAFGFGGINSHVIMEAYAKEAPEVTNKKDFLLKDKVISLSARTKEELIEKLKGENYTVSEGDYRLVIFNPTAEKMKRAEMLIEKNNPWKGKLDIWFSNKPLLAKGEKVIFMFTGIDLGTEMEMQSISDYFEIPYKQVEKGKDQLLGHSINHYYRCRLLDSALKKMGITPDINIGHSVGEWNAVSASGRTTPESIEKLFQGYDPEYSRTTDIFYIAVGCEYERIKSWTEKIPNLYLANDNCPSQILMAGTSEAKNRLVERLKEEQIFHQTLPVNSGYHSPLVPDYSINILGEAYISHLKLQHSDIPVWSATTLEKYPDTEDEYYALFIKHLRETVRFRELIEKLYEQENARLFLQVGIGSLTSFVSDILKEKSFDTISTVNSFTSSLEQFRRIVALLFINGKLINKELIGVKEESILHTRKGREIIVSSKLRTVREFPALKKVTEKYLQKAGTASTIISSSLTEKTTDPVFLEMNHTLQEFAVMQEDILKLYKAQTHLNQTEFKPLVTNDSKRTGTSVEKTLRLTLDEHPYLMDHIVVRQPENWPNPKDLNPVAPLAMTIELLCENTRELLPGKKVVKLSSAGVLKWISVKEPFVAKMSGMWKSEDCISWSIQGYANGDVTLGDEFPPVPKEYDQEIDIGLPAYPPTKIQDIYQYFLFHGPKYQSIVEVMKVTHKGLRAHIRKTEGKGSMLDNLGQLLGLYCHFTLDKNQVTFPMRVDEIYFYQDFTDQRGIFEYTLFIKEINEGEAVSNVVIKRDGKVWCIVKGWHNRRFEFDKKTMNAIMRPKESLLASVLTDNVFYFSHESTISGDFVFDRYLNSKEKEYHKSLFLNKGKEYLISRIALKDAVREYIRKSNEKSDYIFPIEIDIEHDTNGKPYLCGQQFEGIEISVAHKGINAVAIASDKPVGIDIEKIEPRNQEFIEIAFTEKELLMLKEKGNDPEWITRFWVAKEAYGKMLGLGLQGNPKQYEVESIEENNIIIKNTIITTIKHRDNFIVGWTHK
jgi:3-oxoacyl-(acyl-carrier-protein) synthase/phosphopantetheinyl transferase (holo-ACP synthase)